MPNEHKSLCLKDVEALIHKTALEVMMSPQKTFIGDQASKVESLNQLNDRIKTLGQKGSVSRDSKRCIHSIHGCGDAFRRRPDPGEHGNGENGTIGAPSCVFYDPAQWICQEIRQRFCDNLPNHDRIDSGDEG